MNRLGYLSGALRVSTHPRADEHGPACHVLGTIQGFRAAGWSVLSHIAGDRLPENWVAKPGRSLHSSGFVRLGADALRIAAGAWTRRTAFRRLRGRVDWVYERYGAFQALGRSFQRAGIPWILETNAPLALEARSEPGRQAASWRRALEKHEQRTYRACDALVVQTHTLKEILRQWGGIDPAKVFVVPNGVDAGRFSCRRPQRRFSGPTIGFVGSLRRWQALDLLLRAMARVSHDGCDYRLVVVGAGEKRRDWERLALELGLAPRVHFTGSVPVDRVPEWIAGFDLGFSGQGAWVAGQPAYFSPLKLYEYMAAAKPVLASAHEDALRLIEPGSTGYLFAPDSLSGLENALRRAWRERASWPQQGRRAHAAIVAAHSWEARIRGMIAQVGSFLDERRAHAGG